jgi:hypothetical protein
LSVQIDPDFLEFLEYMLRKKGVRFIEEEEDGSVIDIVEALEAGRRAQNFRL